MENLPNSKLDTSPRNPAEGGGITDAAQVLLEQLNSTGVESIYVKRFSKDRSRLGGKAPAESTSPTPRAGKPQPESLIVEEHGARFEIKPYDGL